MAYQIPEFIANAVIGLLAPYVPSIDRNSLEESLGIVIKTITDQGTLTTRKTTERAITPKQAAERLGVHPATVRRLIKDNKLPATKMGHRTIIIPESAIDAMLAGSAKGHLVQPDGWDEEVNRVEREHQEKIEKTETKRKLNRRTYAREWFLKKYKTDVEFRKEQKRRYHKRCIDDPEYLNSKRKRQSERRRFLVFGDLVKARQELPKMMQKHAREN